MRLVLHPKVYSDIDEIMRYYESVATPELADEFYAELRSFLIKAADTPKSFSIRVSRERNPLCVPIFLGCRARAFPDLLPVTNHPFDALNACSGQSFHRVPFLSLSA
jgi:hypothetical protein